jgi:uncharacterized protein YjiS (DUF1127 family)
MAVPVHETLTNCQDGHPPPAYQRTSVAAWIGGTFRLWRSRIRDRHVFDYADDHELSELGLSRWDVEREIARPFWRD